MNHIYQLVWNALHQAWVAVSEVASGLGRRSNRTTTDQRRRQGAVPVRFTIKKIAACAYAISTGGLFLINPAQVSAQTIAPTTLPQGGVVTQGAATLQGAGSSSAPVLNVNQTSQRAVIHWNTFNLGSAATVNFNQPNAQSATLNRVLDMNPSQIFGHINAPGQVTLINPAGVYFSPSAVLDVGALTATSMNQTDADFMAGKAMFSRNGATGSVVNEGTLTAAQTIALLAPEVRNQGTVTASAVAMAAGESIQLNFDAFSRLASLSVTPSQIQTLVENRTAVLASGGQIILSATALRGLQASVVNSGQIDASSLTAQGGRIVLEGDNIQLVPGSSLNASGATGGGTVLVGGDWQGSGSMVQATTVTLAQGATIDASATQSGDGGKVVLWSDVHNANGSTTVNGRIAASGVAAGGQVETSGHTLVMDTAQVQAGGQAQAGLWLIDPYNYTIGAGQAATISASLSAGTSVTVDTSLDVPATGSSGNVGDAGNIAVNANISKTGGVDTTLTLRAHNDIVVASNVAISASTNRLNVVFNSDLDGSGAGAIKLNTGSGITSNGGNITLGGGAAGDGLGNALGSTGNPVGIALVGAALNAGGGNVALRGTGANDSYGIDIRSSSTLVTNGAGTVTLTGIGGAGTADAVVGVNIDSSTVSTASGAITVNGTGGASTGDGQDGVWLGGSAQVATTGGHINLTGAGGGTGSASATNDGVHVEGTALVSAGGAGNLTIVGAGGNGTSGDSDGVALFTGATLQTASGTLSMTGTGGNGNTVDYGIYMPGGTVQTTAGGNIQMTGTARPGSDDAHGVHVAVGRVRTIGGGNITLTGTAGGGANSQGVRLASNAAVSTSSGTVQILGTLVGGATAASSAVSIDGGSSVSANGAISIQGDTLGQAGAVGVRLGASNISTTNNQPITVTTNSYIGSGAEVLSAGSGIVNIRNLSAGALINLGGADVLTGSPLTLGLTDAELDRITAGTLVIGRTGATASGDMTIGAAISPALARNLTLQAGGDIVANASTGITTLANGNVVLNSDADGSGVGAIYLNSGISSNGGNITLGGGLAGDGSGNAIGSSTRIVGVRVFGASLNAGTGNISMRGVGSTSPAIQNYGVELLGNSQVLSSGGNISVVGTGGGTVGGDNDGVRIGDATVRATGNGTVAIQGTGGFGAAGNSDGVVIYTTLGLVETVNGSLSITGTGNGPGPDSDGIYLERPTLRSGAGSITLSGTGGLSGASDGVTIIQNSQVLATAGGNIAITGTGGGGPGAVAGGVYVASSTVNAVAGSVVIAGTLASGSPANSNAVEVGNAATIHAAGALSLTGNANGQANELGVFLGGSASLSTSNASPITITTDSYGSGGSENVSAGTGTVTVQNRTAGTRIDLGGADVLTGSPLTLGLSATQLARITAGTLVVGRNDATAAGAMTVSSAVAPTLATNVILKTGSTIAINAPITVNNTLTLNALGNVSQTVGGNIAATNLLLNGPGNYALATASSNAVSTLAAGGVGVVSYQNGSAVQIGSVDGVNGITASGPVYVGTTTGNLTVARSVSTADASSSAVLLNAGVASAAGTASGGNLLFSGSPAITTGSGGRTTLMTGSVGGSTGVTGFVGAGSGRFRYNSDEVATNYTAPLGSGAYAIYREAPTVDLATGNVSITYGDTLPSLSGTVSGAVNGDVLGASVAVGGALSGSLNYTAGSHTLTPGSASALALGYAVGTVTAGSLSVAQKTLTSSLVGIDRNYDGSTSATVNAAPGGLTGGDSVVLAYTAANFADKHVGKGKAITVSGISLVGADALNYTIASTGSASASIFAASITLASSTVNKTYDGSLGAPGTATVSAGTLFGGDTLSGGTFAFTDKNVGPGKTVTASGITLNDGNGGANYLVSYVNNTSSSISPAGLTVTAPTVSKTYDGTTNATGNAIVGALAGSAAGEQVGLAATLAYTDKNVGIGNKTTRASGLTVVDSSGTDVTANYVVNYVDNTVSSITPAPLTVTANADARFVGKPDVPGYAGAHYDGLVGGETPSVLGGTLAIDRPNALTENAVGSYAGALVPSGLTSGNYSISFVPGTFTIVPAEQLLVRLVNTSTVYGTAPTLNVFSVQYLAADQTTIIDLAGSGVNNTYNYTDGVGGGITFTPGPQGAGSSSAGHTPVGNYALGDAAPGVVGNNFLGSPVFVGNLAVTPKPITPSATGIDKTYNGSTDMPNLVLNPAGLEPGDNLVVNGSGAFAFHNVGSNLPYVVRDMALGGGDAGNYYLAGSNFLGGSNANITPAAITLSSSNVVKTYDGTTSALGNAVVTGGTLFGADTLAGGIFAFTDKNAGLGNKTVTTAGVVVADGNGGNNYTVTYANNTTSTITPASITVATSSVSKPFDGTTDAQGTAVVAGGSLFGTDRLVGGTFAFTDPNVGNNKTVLTSGVQIDDGNGGGNYTITYAGNSTSRIVVPALPVAGVWTQEILLPHPLAVPASPLAPSQSALEGVAVGASAVGREGGAAAGKGAAGCVGTSQTGLDCDRRDGRNGYVVVTPVRNVSPVLAGQVLVQVVGMRNATFEAALPLQARTSLRAQPTPATAALPNGQPLPAWLRFDPQSLAFTAQAVPTNALPLTTLVRSNNYRVEVEISEVR
nr:YDG domain-containing protein [uncultured Albidiferax sp.]